MNSENIFAVRCTSYPIKIYYPLLNFIPEVADVKTVTDTNNLNTHALKIHECIVKKTHVH